MALLPEEQPAEKFEAINRREEAKARDQGTLPCCITASIEASKTESFPLSARSYSKESKLHLNRMLMLRDQWDEGQIVQRAQLLFDVAVKLWRGPGA